MSESPPYPPATEEFPPAVPAPSAGPLARLEAEWRQLRRAFAYHPHVEIVPLTGDPPVEYQVNYKVTTLAIDEAGQLAYVTACALHVWLPPQFPYNAPVVRPMAAAFHPNVAVQWIHLNPPWRPEASLVDVVAQVGLLLAFQSYDPNAVVNPVAMHWVYTNPHLLPTDPAASFSPSAGGEPLSRMMRFGPATLRQLQERLESAAERLVGGDPAPPPEELEQLSAEASQTLATFSDADLPLFLRTSAAELRDLVDSLVAPQSPWPRIGRQVVLAKAAATAAHEVVKAEEALRRVLAAEAAAPHGATPHGAAPHAVHRPARHDERPEEPAGVVARLPAPSVIEPGALALREAVAAAERVVADLREKLGELAAAPRVPPAGSKAGNTPLARLLARELSRLSDAAEPARAAGAWLASLEPMLDAARHESAAADRALAWAEHRASLRTGTELVGRLKATPPAELQAYHLETAAGRSGPWEFEQRVDSGDGGPALAVWNLRSRVVRVIDADTEEVVARGDGRSDTRVAVPRAAAGGGSTGNGTVFVAVGEHAEELRLQVESLLQHAADALRRLRPPDDAAPPPPAPPSTWAARLAEDLDQPEAQRLAEEEHRRAIDDWKRLAADLAALGRFKQRLATYHLLTRLIEFIRRARAERERLQAALTRADAHLAATGTRSAPDPETGAMIIPAQYAAEYSRHLAERDRLQQQLQRLEIATGNAAERVKLRLGKGRFYGAADLPRPHLLPRLPAAYAELQPHLTDDALRPVIRRLEELLVTPLPVVPAATAPAKPPAGDASAAG